MEYNYDKLCAAFPVFARCSKNMFIHCLMDVSIAWAEVVVEPRKISSGIPTSSQSSQLPTTTLAMQHRHFLSGLTPFQQSGMQAACSGLVYGERYMDFQRAAAVSPYEPYAGHGPEADLSPYDPEASPSDSAGLSPCDSVDLSPGDSAGDSPYDSADDGGADDAELNAGEAVDMKLFQHWAASEPVLRVAAGELEQFGRSKSF